MICDIYTPDGPPINKNIYTMSHRERRHLRIDELPGNLSEALDELEKDDLVRETLGDQSYDSNRSSVVRLAPAFRLHLPSKIRYHNTKRDVGPGNILA